jgi:hypothetical protein
MIMRIDRSKSFMWKVTGENRAGNKRRRGRERKIRKGQECTRKSVAQKGVGNSN